MKQFNLTEYLENPSLKVVTRDGRLARVICTDLKHKYPVIAALDYGYDEEKIFFYDEYGRLGGVTDSSCDLFFEEKIRKRKDGLTYINQITERTNISLPAYIGIRTMH